MVKAIRCAGVGTRTTSPSDHIVTSIYLTDLGYYRAPVDRPRWDDKARFVIHMD